MKNKVISLSAIILLLIMFSCNEGQDSTTETDPMPEQTSLIYPNSKKVDTIDEYFGVQVSDPYRWLENDTLSEVASWVKEQNKVTFDFLKSIPFKEKIQERLTTIWNFAKQSAPFKEGDRYYYYANDGLQNQSILYTRQSLDDEPKVFIDPNILSADGTISLAGMGFSSDGKYCGYSISKGGSDWNEIFIKNVETGENLDDHLKWVKFSSISWAKDGFFYSCYDAPEEGKELSNKNTFHKVYYHKLGAEQSDDILIFEDKKDPLRTFYSQVTEDQKYLAIYEMKSTHGNALYIKELEEDVTSGDFIKLAEGFEYEYSLIDNIDGKLLIKTNDNSPRYKLISVDIQNPEKENWTVLIPERKDVLKSVGLYGGKIVSTYMHDAYSKVEIFNPDGSPDYEVELPGIGTMSGFSGKKEDNIAFYSFSSFTVPTTVFKYDFLTKESTLYFEPKIDFDFSQYETKQVFYKSKDGTDIPLFICHKKDIELNGNNPALLYGYGGFNISMTPSFSIRRTVWLENGGVLAVACLRGGGEFGEEWHIAGTKLQKQNVFDDFIGAAEYLINEKFTNPEKLAIRGGSNGGLLVGACANQRPDLFKVALPAVGVMDMLRFHKFTIGWGWTGDYGSSDDSVEFNYIYKYSPLHNIRENVDYPAILVTTADHDDRVVPAHSFKYIATLQEKYKGPNPVLIRIDVMAGHGAGKPTSKTIEENADIWAFTFFNMGITPNY